MKLSPQIFFGEIGMKPFSKNSVTLDGGFTWHRAPAYIALADRAYDFLGCVLKPRSTQGAGGRNSHLNRPYRLFP